MVIKWISFFWRGVGGLWWTERLPHAYVDWNGVWSRVMCGSDKGIGGDHLCLGAPVGNMQRGGIPVQRRLGGGEEARSNLRSAW